MNIEQDLQRALRRQPAPTDFADRVLAHIQERAGEPAAARSLSPESRVPNPGQEPPRSAGTALGRPTRWLAAAAAAVITITGGAQYYAHQQAIAEAERVKQDIQIALRITSEKLAFAQQRVERSLQDSPR